MGVDALIAALADKIREKFGVTGSLSFAKMTEALDAVKLGADVSEVTLSPSEGLYPKKFVDANGQVVECTMVNRGAVDITLSALEKEYGVPAGYHNGNGKVRVVTESRTVTPTAEEQIVTPTEGKLLSQVSVSAMPHAVSPCSLTVTMGETESADVVYCKHDKGAAVPSYVYVAGGKTVTLTPALGSQVVVLCRKSTWFYEPEYSGISGISKIGDIANGHYYAFRFVVDGEAGSIECS